MDHAQAMLSSGLSFLNNEVMPEIRAIIKELRVSEDLLTQKRDNMVKLEKKWEEESQRWEQEKNERAEERKKWEEERREEEKNRAAAVAHRREIVCLDVGMQYIYSTSFLLYMFERRK